MNKKKKADLKSGLRLIDGNTARKTKSYNDIDLNNWKKYDNIETGTLWQFSTRTKTNGHKFDYHGNYIPQIAEQLYNRYTKPGDIVLDLFLGSGTSAIEAINLKRKCIGIEIKQDLSNKVRKELKEFDNDNLTEVICEDSTTAKAYTKVNDSLKKFEAEKAQFLILHPPYADIIKFSNKKKDLSNCASTEEFLDKFAQVAENGYKCLENGRYAALIIGDKYSKGELVPLGFYCMQKMNEIGFKTKSIIIKNIEGNEIGKGKASNLWRYRALAGGFYIFKHEYIIIFEKNTKSHSKIHCH